MSSGRGKFLGPLADVYTITVRDSVLAYDDGRSGRIAAGDRIRVGGLEPPVRGVALHALKDFVGPTRMSLLGGEGQVTGVQRLMEFASPRLPRERADSMLLSLAPCADIPVSPRIAAANKRARLLVGDPAGQLQPIAVGDRVDPGAAGPSMTSWRWIRSTAPCMPRRASWLF